MNDYQNDYRMMYEELRALTRLYFEIKYDDGTLYDDDEYAEALEEVEFDLCTLIGIVDGGEVE